jgi:hypothetical protein
VLFSGIEDNNTWLNSNEVCQAVYGLFSPSRKQLFGNFRLKKLKIISGKIKKNIYLQHLSQFKEKGTLLFI